MTEMIILIVFVVGGLLFLSQMEEPKDPSFTHECDVNRLVKESLNREKPRNHTYSSALIFKK